MSYETIEDRNRSKLELNLDIKEWKMLCSRGPGGGGALDFQMVGVCRWGVENRTLS